MKNICICSFLSPSFFQQLVLFWIKNHYICILKLAFGQSLPPLSSANTTKTKGEWKSPQMHSVAFIVRFSFCLFFVFFSSVILQFFCTLLERCQIKSICRFIEIARKVNGNEKEQTRTKKKIRGKHFDASEKSTIDS